MVPAVVALHDADPTPALPTGSPSRRRVLAPRIAIGIWAALTLLQVIRYGVPTDRRTIAIVVISGLVAGSLGQGWRRVRQVLVDWLPFTAVLLAYDRTRAVADTVGLPIHEGDVLTLERWLFGGTEPTVWLQQHLYSPAQVHWYDFACALVYTSHFFATPLLAVYLWLRHRPAFLVHITRVITLSLAGLATYVLFPEAPPWLAAQDGLTGPVARISTRGWTWVHLDAFHDALASAQTAGTNAIAAMPSLHFAFAVQVALALGSWFRGRARWALAAYPAAMAFTLVYSGEHYVIDLVAGLVYAVAVHLLVGRWWRHRVGTTAPACETVPA